MSDGRIQMLEEKLAFLEDTVQQLNDVVTNQQQQLRTLQSGYDILKQKYSELLSGESDGLSQIDQKPPHY